MPKKSKPVEQVASELAPIPAGDFSAWLAQTRQALLDNRGAQVACGECKACCDSSYFIHIRPEETRTLERIDERILFAAPTMPAGNVLMGYDEHGNCPMLIEGKCSIYPDRPRTCRNYDCRVFTATGIEVGGPEKARIVDRVEKWQFSYPSEQDRREHSAVLATARFIGENARLFPGGAIPQSPSQLAILAIKTYGVLLAMGGEEDLATDAKKDVAIAIVEASKSFDAPAEGSAARR